MPSRRRFIAASMREALLAGISRPNAAGSPNDDERRWLTGRHGTAASPQEGSGQNTLLRPALRFRRFGRQEALDDMMPMCYARAASPSTPQNGLLTPRYFFAQFAHESTTRHDDGRWDAYSLASRRLILYFAEAML